MLKTAQNYTQYDSVNILHSFGDGTLDLDGFLPMARLIQGSDGNLYGTTMFDTYLSGGTVFQISTAGSINILHLFGSGNDGAYPVDALLQGTDGNYFGTTFTGGSIGLGTTFEVPTSGVEGVLHSFGDGATLNDGLAPDASLIVGVDGNFYGTTTTGGSSLGGTAFRMSPTGTVTTLHSFLDGSVPNDGFEPNGLVLAGDGNFYGTTVYGGSTISSDTLSLGNGVAFRMSPSGSVTVLHSFGDGTVANDGINPSGALIQGADGNFYGLTLAGGAADDGVIYCMTPSGTVTILHSFGDGTVLNDGQSPVDQLALGSDGNFYGATLYGGSANDGALFTMWPGGSVGVLHSFGDGSVLDDGQNPEGGLVQATDGNFYGTASQGGSVGGGVAFQLVTGLPEAPSGLVAALTPSGVQLTWSPSASASGYNIYRGTSPGQEGANPVTANVQDTTYTDTELAAATTYYYVVTAVDGQGEGPRSNEALIQTPTLTTTASLAGTQGANAWYTSSVTVTLSPQETNGQSTIGATYYTIDGSAAQTYSAPFTVSGDGVHTITFWSVDQALVTEAANRQNIAIDGTPPTLTFETTSPAPNAAGWNNTAVTVGFDAADVTSGVASAVPASPLSFTAEGADQTQTVIVTDNAGNVATTTSPSVNIDMTPPVTTALVSGDVVTLTATDNLSGVASTSYVIDGGAAAPYTEPFSVSRPGSHTITFWSVDNAGNTEIIESATVINPPDVPADLTAAQGDTTVILNWNSVMDATAYNVYRGTSSRGELATALATGVTGTSYTDTGLTDGTTYYYEVTAVDSGGEGSPSNETSATPVPASATFLRIDGVTHGTWKGVHGADGYNVIGDNGSDNPAVPKYARVTPSKNSSTLWSSASIADCALQTPSASTNRVAGTWYAASSFSVDLNLIDGKSHEVALYLLDWANSGRKECVTITNSSTHRVISTESVSAFGSGLYYSWQIRGHVTITVTRTAGVNAVLSGLFFGSGSGAYPITSSKVVLSAAGGCKKVSLGWTTAAGATSYNVYRGIASGAENTTPYATHVKGLVYVDSAVTGGTTYFYRVMPVCAAGGSTASTEASARPWETMASFVKVDTATEGNWKGVYGASGYNVIGDSSKINPAYPSFVKPVDSGVETAIWEVNSPSKSALNLPGSGSSVRIAAAWYDPTSFAVTLNPTDETAHRVALYLLDWGSGVRKETITITDARSRSTLSTVSASDFASGSYYVWDVQGDITITVKKDAGSNAVVSGLFFD